LYIILEGIDNVMKGASIAMVLERAAFEIVVLEICHGVSWGNLTCCYITVSWRAHEKLQFSTFFLTIV
jgi:hypothetical protein